MQFDFNIIGSIAALNGVAMFTVSPPPANEKTRTGWLMNPLLVFNAVFFWGAGIYYGFPTQWALTHRRIGIGFAEGTFDEKSIAAVSFRALACYQATMGLIQTLALRDQVTQRFAATCVVVWGITTLMFLSIAVPKQYIDFSTKSDMITVGLYPERFIEDYCEDMIFIGILSTLNLIAIYQRPSEPVKPAGKQN